MHCGHIKASRTEVLALICPSPMISTHLVLSTRSRIEPTNPELLAALIESDVTQAYIDLSMLVLIIYDSRTSSRSWLGLFTDMSQLIHLIRTYVY